MGSKIVTLKSVQWNLILDSQGGLWFRCFWEIYCESGNLPEKKGWVYFRYKLSRIWLLWSLFVVFVIPTFLDLEAMSHVAAECQVMQPGRVKGLPRGWTYTMRNQERTGQLNFVWRLRVQSTFSPCKLPGKIWITSVETGDNSPWHTVRW